MGKSSRRNRFYYWVIFGSVLGICPLPGLANAQESPPEEIILTELPGGCTYNHVGGFSDGADFKAGGVDYSDDMKALGGNDRIGGLGCGDWLEGNADRDLIQGAHGNDDIDLGLGDDNSTIFGDNQEARGAGGGAGDDLIFGGPGDDDLVDCCDHQPSDLDRLYGEDNADLIHARDGDRLDSAAGGTSAFDACEADSRSEKTSCEFNPSGVELE